MPMNFDLVTDIPDLGGKIIFITGGTAGLGAQTIRVLAGSQTPPSHIYFTGRCQSSASALISSLPAEVQPTVTFLHCEFASLASVKACVASFLAQQSRIDILMLNAGILDQTGTTKDGYQIHFGVNYMSHALFLKLFLPNLLSTAALPESDVRVVWLTANAFRMHPKSGIDFENLKSPHEGAGLFGGFMLYGQSKLAVLLQGKELARRYPQLTSVIVHPHRSNTGLISNLPFWKKALVWVGSLGDMASVEVGAMTQIWAAVGKGVESGVYYESTPGAKGTLDSVSDDQDLGMKLWDWTDSELKGSL